MRTLPRWVGLPIAALILVVAVIGVQLANGGGTYEPLKPADACAERDVTSQSEGIEGLAERLVLLGLDGAACQLHVSREQLTLDLAQGRSPSDTEVEAMRSGLQNAVERMKDDGSLPSASDLADEALENADLNGFLKRAIRAIPDGVIDSALTMDDVLKRAIDGLDLRAVLANLDDQGDLERQVEAAITQAVKDSLIDRVRGLL